MSKQDEMTAPAEAGGTDRKERTATEPDPNREQRVGGEGDRIGKSTEQEDRK